MNWKLTFPILSFLFGCSSPDHSDRNIPETIASLDAGFPKDSSGPEPRPRYPDAAVDVQMADSAPESGQDASMAFGSACDPNQVVTGCPEAYWADTRYSTQGSCYSRHTPDTPSDMYGRCTFSCDSADPSRRNELIEICVANGGQCMMPGSGLAYICVVKQ